MRPAVAFFLGVASMSAALRCPAATQKLPPSLESCTILTPARATPLETLAAREVRRYVYLRTGRLLPIARIGPGDGEREKTIWASLATPAVAMSGSRPGSEPFRASEPNTIVVARKDRAVASALGLESGFQGEVAALKPQEYLLKTVQTVRGWTLLLTGGDDLATLYAAYRFAEHLGVGFYLHGDVIPDYFPGVGATGSTFANGAARLQERPPGLPMPCLEERGRPLFALRGIQPFHDFPEGPDWWNREDYLAILSQLPKLRLNFFGLHTYPEGAPNAEPTVWIGLPQDVGDKGKIKFSYPASYQNTARGNWGYTAKKTSDFAFGSSQLFERDEFGAEAMFGLCPHPASAQTSNEMFDRIGTLLREAFTHAHELGIKTCVGTETPLTVPKQVQEHLRSLHLNPTNSPSVQKLYEGLFRRLMAAYPVDYYWFWTPEQWTWESVKPEQVRATTNDLALALTAAKAAQAPFQLATCGWVLGPPEDRGLFDQFLPKDWPMSCINREVGKSPVELGFARVTGRPKWAIPWLEDDPALTSPQLWVGRMRHDALEALDYGCTGLMGIHWRTRVLGPNVSALAQAAWDQTAWRRAPTKVSGWIGGQAATFPRNRIEGTPDPALYQSLRYGMSAYRLAIPNGQYRVTLKFCEPHFEAKGKRVFGLKLQTQKVKEHFDILAVAGKNRAMDLSFQGVEVADGWLNIEFLRETENPAVCAIVVQGPEFEQRINCGGPAYHDYSADLPALPRYQPTLDFYQDWTRRQFGPGIAPQAAQILARLDGNLPRPSDWIDGPGGIKPDARPWEEVSPAYSFARQFAALRPRVVGAGNLERFDYWSHTFGYMRAMAQLNCLWAQFDQALDKVKAEPDPRLKKLVARELALPRRKQLVRGLAQVYAHLLAIVSNAGEMGTLANWEQHIQPKLMAKPGEALAKALGEPLPIEAQLPRGYDGPLRVFVPATRTSLRAGEALCLKILVLAREPPKDAALFWRPLGARHFLKAPLEHVARGVYRVDLPVIQFQGNDFEYHVKVTPRRGGPVFFPATAPTLNQTVLILPASIGS